jgi:hypothetical protein
MNRSILLGLYDLAETLAYTAWQLVLSQIGYQSTDSDKYVAEVIDMGIIVWRMPYLIYFTSHALRTFMWFLFYLVQLHGLYFA